MRTLLLILLCVFFQLVSCTKNDPKEKDPEVNINYQYIRDLGYKDSEIKDTGDEYLVDGDILFSKEALPDFSIFGTTPKIQQSGRTSYLSYSVQSNILVRIDPSMNSLKSEIEGAIAIWDSVLNSRIRFVVTEGTNQDVLIVNAELGRGICGAAYFPMNGLPGSLVKINKDEIAGNTLEERVRTIAHQLGHVIGFRHTNWYSTLEPASKTLPDNIARGYAAQLLKMPDERDPSSLMNSGQCGSGSINLSNSDILTLQSLYPEYPPVPGTVPVFRYYMSNLEGNYQDEDYILTTEIIQTGSGSNTYIFQGVAFFAFAEQGASTVPVYRYHSVSDNDHYYTITLGDLGGGVGYIFDDIAFYAYPYNTNNSVPIHLYTNYQTTAHSYSNNQEKIGSDSEQWGYSGIAFYAH
ncbi:hypothetical protein GCM10027051_14170 [Niabella terrae]